MFLNIVDQHVSPEDVGSHPECGIMIKFTTIDKPSSIIDLFKSCNQTFNKITQGKIKFVEQYLISFSKINTDKNVKTH